MDKRAHPTPLPLHAFGCYVRDVGQHELLTAEEELTLSRAARAGDHLARQRMIEGNLRLVIRTARQYRHSSLPIDDLVEEGNLGLMHALDKYDPSLGYRFSTYAIWWIRQYIERGIMNQARIVRLPVHMAKRLNACLRASRELAQTQYREPSDEDIARRAGRPLSEVRELLPWREQPASLDARMDEQDGHDNLADPIDRNPARATAHDDLLRALGRWLERLQPRERHILALRFGLTGEEAQTFEEIARQIGLTRERVRQIHIEALSRLRLWMQEEQLDADALDDV